MARKTTEISGSAVRGRPALVRLYAPAPARAGQKRAFSLIELSVVIAIMLVLTILAVGGYSNLRRSRSVKTSAQNVHAAFVAARSYAITTNGWYRVVFQLKNPTSGVAETSYWIDEIYPDNAVDPSVANPDATPTLDEYRRSAKMPKLTTPQGLPDGVQLADIYVKRNNHGSTDPETTTTAAVDPLVTIRFYPEGSSDDARVRLTQDGSTNPDTDVHAYMVRLRRETGKPQIVAEERR